MITIRAVTIPALLLTVSGCAHRGNRVVGDYMFAIAGVVRDGEGQPIEGVQVTMEAATTLYEAITPVRRQELTTDEHGSFLVTLLSHNAENPYTLRVEKSGYVTQTITGSAPPHQQHVIILVRSQTMR